ncbi:hypothetical protein CEE37_02560 [candidate division LCP-89 bacterium B3_LCP]|uniref:Tetratricopeptide repeat protein n=1 Tax=candidate division LCP-89 bacterium B3_LCP TaxID=2012998 RepID=A0A532V2U7_UNCL8|nr:MAG: hypothetical protein CEE37_02560 [candidate division LCP-89 bacterium B3_LCP]
MRNSLIIFHLVCFCTVGFCRTIVFEDSSNRASVQEILEKTFLLEYEEALDSVDKLQERLPDHTIGPLLRAGVLYCRMLDLEDRLDMDQFVREYEKAWELSEVLKKSGEEAEANLYQGVLLGYRALLEQRRGRWWPAVKIGIKSVGRMKACLKADSTFSDALLGVGTYKYWSSKATDFINWLPIIPDQKEKGIELMRRAMNEGLFAREIARSTLVWTLIDAGQPHEAVELSLEGLRLYPGSRHFLWPLADGYFLLKQFNKAVATYQQLYDSIQPLKRNNHYNELIVCKQMARIYYRLSQPEEVLKWTERGLSYPLDDDVKKRKKQSLGKLQELRDKAMKTIEKRSAGPDN